MRMAFGLVGMLVTLGVVVWILHAFYLPQTQADLNVKKHSEETLNQIGGTVGDGRRVTETYTLFPDTRSDGKLADFQVSRLEVDSPMARVMGLKQDDVILAAWGQGGVRNDMYGATDVEDARNWVQEAYNMAGVGAGKLLVQRGEQRMILPGGQLTDARGNPLESTAAPMQATTQPTGQAAPQPEKKDPPADDTDPLKAIRERSKFIPGGL